MRFFEGQPRRCPSRPRRGLILLVVLSMLAFLGVLVVTYISFSSKSQRTSYSLASREFHMPPVDNLFEEALMKVVRGTDDPGDPFFGEDLLSDLYGRRDAFELRVTPRGRLTDGFNGTGTQVLQRGPTHIGGGFVRFPVDLDFVTNWDGNPLNDPDARPGWSMTDDAFAGRVITFLDGPLANRSFRVLRSAGARIAGTPELVNLDSFFIELDAGLVVTLSNGAQVTIDSLLTGGNVNPLFYPVGPGGEPNNNPFRMWVNSAPQNSPGIGLLNGSMVQFRLVLGHRVPVALLPNAYDGIATVIGGNPVNKALLGGDYDEAYDAPDFNNWFLSGRVRVQDPSGGFVDRVIPSFHRPSVINYLVNLKDWSDSPTLPEVNEIVDALRRATYRPLPFPQPDGRPVFSGGSSDFGLSTPLNFTTGNMLTRIARLDLLASALTTGPWDVDNDGDGIADSVWIDIGLPLITARDGKLLRPLIAPLIEDTGGKLNLNAHGNYAQLTANYRGNPPGAWATSTAPTPAQVYRGLGWGPADIALPSGTLTANAISADGNAINNAELLELLRRRNMWGRQTPPAFPPAGTNGNDALDALRTGERRPLHTADGGVGHSSDPFGRGGIGVGRGGQLLAAVSGTEVEPAAGNQPVINETVNDPYERDPTGRLTGDNVYLMDELEAILRGNHWDNDLLPQRLRNLLRTSLNDKRELSRMLTTLSTSFDHPSAVPPPGNRFPPLNINDPDPPGPGNPSAPYNSPAHLAQVILSRLRLNHLRGVEPEPAFRNRIATQVNLHLARVIAPELLQGRKLDINRPLGNGFDDNGNGVIDEPAEFGNGRDDNGNGIIDEVGEFYPALPVPGWNDDAYPLATSGALDPTPGGPIQTRFGGRVPDYNFGQRDVDLSASGRELLARHLYTLMMALLAEIDQTTGERYPLPVVDDTVVPDRQLYNARRIAQWAVNVVDYRDPDSVMTRFVYDPNPLDGWDLAIDVNGDGTPNIGTGRFDQSLPGADPLPPIPSPVVWGVESPELVFMEGHALHDVRVRDTDLEGGGGGSRKDANDPMADIHTDQVRLPQGSLFLELFCPRAVPTGNAQHLQGVPLELYEFDNTINEYRLDLDRIAPPRPGMNVGAPVWRIAISEPHYPGSPNETLNPRLLRMSHPDTASFDPRRLIEVDDLSGLWNQPLQYDRFIIFNHINNVAALNEVAAAMTPPPVTGQPPVLPAQIFFAHNDDNAHLNLQRGVLPGQYLTLSPRLLTNLGSQIFPNGAPPTDVNPARFQLLPAEGMIQFDPANNRMTPDTSAAGPIAPSVGMIIKTFPPAGWANDVFENGRVGLNVSEPLPRGVGYYPQPTQQYDGGTNYLIRDAYVDLSDPTLSSPLDEPQDLAVASPVGELSVVRGHVPEPFLGLERDFCSAFLQRLADPLKPFDPVFNPYVTVDWMTIDLTVFSGEENGADVDLFPQTLNEYATQMRVRNGHDVTGNPAGILFSYRTDEPDAPAPAAVLPPGDPNRTAYFQLGTPNGTIDSSFGYLNIGPTRFGVTLGSTVPMMNTRDRGLPQMPFSLHPWLNRPYASHLELMMVPATSPGRLFEEYTPNNLGLPQRYHPSAGVTIRPATPPGPNPIGDGDFAIFHGRQRHLLNFFMGSELEFDTAQFPRIFDYVTTLPRFRGEVDLVNPARVTLQAGGSPAAVGSRFFGRTLQPPFNFFHDGRRQGQINLNTLSDYPVWVGLMHGHLLPIEKQSPENDAGQDMSFQKFLRSRRGYPTQAAVPRRLVDGGAPQSNAGQRYNYAPEQLDGNFPTQFAGVYRHFADADMAPQLPQVHNPTPKLPKAGLSGSLLRQDVQVNDPWPGNRRETSLFLRENQTGDPHRNVDRNPFANYQTLMRMPNLVTKESQVYAVWITMGLFEASIDPATDTISLGQEYQQDIGQNQRYQMLYIIDRSRPVGFRPGQDLNARDVVIYERRLQ